MQSNKKDLMFPEGFLWGEKAWEAFARPCLVFSEYLEENNDKVYRICKMQQNNI